MRKNTIITIPVFLGPQRVEQERFQQSAPTHSGAEGNETLNKKLWENIYIGCLATRA